MAVKVTFTYEPDEPEDHAVGMSEKEYGQLMDNLMQMGAYDVEVRQA